MLTGRIRQYQPNIIKFKLVGTTNVQNPICPLFWVLNKNIIYGPNVTTYVFQYKKRLEIFQFSLSSIACHFTHACTIRPSYLEIELGEQKHEFKNGAKSFLSSAIKIFASLQFDKIYFLTVNYFYFLLNFEAWMQIPQMQPQSTFDPIVNSSQ